MTDLDDDERFFEDLNNPTFDEIRNWAIHGEYQPTEDWDLSVQSALSLEQFESLLSDSELEDGAKYFFIECLYIYVGDAVRHSDRVKLDAITTLIETSPLAKTLLKKWADRSLELIERPSSYSYDYWGCTPLKFEHEGGL